jgi:hypothetical protein
MVHRTVRTIIIDTHMKKKLLYILILTIVSGGFFALGWHLHQPPVAPADDTPDGPLFSLGTPYLHIVYGDVGEPDSCPPTNTIVVWVFRTGTLERILS